MDILNESLKKEFPPKPHDKSSHKKSKKLKKEKKAKKAKKHKKKKTTRSSSSSTSDSEEAGSQWVEKVPNPISPNAAHSSSSASTPKQREEWMTTPCLFACVTRDQLRAAKEPSKKKKEEEESKFMLDRPGQSGRELNPYWADGGTGLPCEKPVEPQSLALAETTVGDQGASWLRRALQRAKEQAAESGRSLEEVAAERWGSLQKLEELLSEAEGRKVSIREEQSRGAGRYGGRKQDDWRRQDPRYSEVHRGSWRREKNQRESMDGSKYHDKYRDSNKWDDRRKAHFEKPNDDFDLSGHHNRNKEDGKDSSKTRFRGTSSDDATMSTENSRGSHQKSSFDRREHHQFAERDSSIKSGLPFQKPFSSDDQHRSTTSNFSQGSSGNRNWRKKDFISKSDNEAQTKEISKGRNVEKSESSGSDSSSESPPHISEPQQTEIPTDQEMNNLAAKLVKAEILGNDALVAELKKKLELARQCRAANPAAVAAAKQATKKEQEVVLLTRTDSKGFARPLQTGSAHPEPLGGRRKKQKAETHGADGQRLRYFPDDDKYSLQDMFQREKLTTVEDQNEMFTKLAGKDGRQEHDLDMDDIFSERAREKESEGKLEARERDRAIREHQRKEKMLDNCRWCFESKHLQRHLVVAVGNKSYICLPPYQSITDGHCLIIPLHHTICATQLDEDVWEEMQDFRKALVKMFAADDEDCVFFESAMHLNKFPHMVLQCIPLPRENGDVAPIYFKKAILESESEWSTNKKLVDLSKKDVRRSVPKGLPYFSVDFGMQGGFAHVIEDEKLFPRNFAEAIIGGMLDLDHSIWRKPRLENFDTQRKKSLEFAKRWRDYDFTKKMKEKRKRAEDSESSSSS